MGPEEWALLAAELLKSKYEIDVDEYTLAYDLMEADRIWNRKLIEGIR